VEVETAGRLHPAVKGRMAHVAGYFLEGPAVAHVLSGFGVHIVNRL
jgi:hypothetical protein